MVFIEGLVTQIVARAMVPILVNTADRVKSPTLSPGVLMWGVNICQIPHLQGQYFWSIDVNSLRWPGGGGGSIDWCIIAQGYFFDHRKQAENLNCYLQINYFKSNVF